MTAVSRTVRKTRKRVRTCGEEEPGESEESLEEPSAIAPTDLPIRCPKSVPTIMDAHSQYPTTLICHGCMRLAVMSVDASTLTLSTYLARDACSPGDGEVLVDAVLWGRCLHGDEGGSEGRGEIRGGGACMETRAAVRAGENEVSNIGRDRQLPHLPSSPRTPCLPVRTSRPYAQSAS